MTLRYTLVQDTLLANCVPADADFLQGNVTKVHVDCYTLGKERDEERDADEDSEHARVISKNHWVLILETEHSGQVRLDVVHATNPRSGLPGVLMLHKLHYEGPSNNTAYRMTYTWKGAPTTIQQFLEHTLENGWHRYQMTPTDKGSPKGCRHHV